MSRTIALLTSAAVAAMGIALATPSYAGDIVGLVTKTNTNPFFVKMKEGFEAKAKELGLTPQAYAGKEDGDNDGEVKAIEQLIAAGVCGRRRYRRRALLVQRRHKDSCRGFPRRRVTLAAPAVAASSMPRPRSLRLACKRRSGASIINQATIIILDSCSAAAPNARDGMTRVGQSKPLRRRNAAE